MDIKMGNDVFAVISAVISEQQAGGRLDAPVVIGVVDK